MAEPPLDVRPVVTGRSARMGPIAAAAVAVGFVTVIVAGRFGSQAPSRPPASVAPVAVAASPGVTRSAAGSPSVEGAPAPASPKLAAESLSATPVPRPSRLVPFRIPASAGGHVTYVSPNLGFSVPMLIEIAPSGYWDEGGPPSGAGGMLTFDVPAEASAVGNGAIRVVVGSERDPAPVRVPADDGPVVPLWAPNLVTLVQEYALLLEGQFGAQGQLTLDGEQAHIFERPRGAAAVVLAAHEGRIYILASLLASPQRGSSRRAFTEFLAAFRFVDATVTP